MTRHCRVVTHMYILCHEHHAHSRECRRVTQRGRRGTWQDIVVWWHMYILCHEQHTHSRECRRVSQRGRRGTWQDSARHSRAMRHPYVFGCLFLMYSGVSFFLVCSLSVSLAHAHTHTHMFFVTQISADKCVPPHWSEFAPTRSDSLAVAGYDVRQYAYAYMYMYVCVCMCVCLNLYVCAYTCW